MSKYNLHIDGVSVEAVFNKLGGVEGARRFLRDELVLTEPEHIIDLTTTPYCLDGWEILPAEEQIWVPEGSLKWDPSGLELFLIKEQERGYDNGEKIRKALKGRKPLTAHVLDYLLKEKNQHLIPEEWKGKDVFFWGTIYRNADGDLCVRCLYWRDDHWDSGWHCIESDFYSSFTAVRLAA